jgi:hypothetical protein
VKSAIVVRQCLGSRRIEAEVSPPRSEDFRGFQRLDRRQPMSRPNCCRPYRSLDARTRRRLLDLDRARGEPQRRGGRASRVGRPGRDHPAGLLANFPHLWTPHV